LFKVRYLGSVGGKDVADTTRHVMRDLMTNAVAGRMNFVGRGGKTAIRNMRLLKVIIGSKIFDIHDLHALALVLMAWCWPFKLDPVI
jgi:hypothetical protein